MLMYKPEGGFHNFGEHEVEAAKKDGWVDGTPVRERILALKQKPVIVAAHEPLRRGRPRKEDTLIEGE